MRYVLLDWLGIATFAGAGLHFSLKADPLGVAVSISLLAFLVAHFSARDLIFHQHKLIRKQQELILLQEEAIESYIQREPAHADKEGAHD